MQTITFIDFSFGARKVGGVVHDGYSGDHHQYTEVRKEVYYYYYYYFYFYYSYRLCFREARKIITDSVLQKYSYY